MSEDDFIDIKDLPGDLPFVAEIIGLEKTMRLVKHFGGTYIRVPKCEGLVREIRDKNIRQI